MPRKAHDLFDAIASFPALHAAAVRAARGKRAKPGVAAFLADLEKEVLRLERELKTGRYRPGRYTTIEIFDPKHRVVSAAPFRDRVVRHAFCAVVEPLFERGFIHDSSANRNRNTTGKRNNNNGFRIARTLDGPSRRPHGAAGCATERPGTVMTSEGPAPLLPRPGGGEAPAFVRAFDDPGCLSTGGSAATEVGVRARTTTPGR